MTTDNRSSGEDGEQCGSVLDGSAGSANQAEEVLADVAANLFRSIEAVGGRLKITSRRLLFEPHAINVQTNPEEILLGDVVEVGKRNTPWIVPNGMFVRTRAGQEFKFVVWGRNELIRLIQSSLPEPGTT